MAGWACDAPFVESESIDDRGIRATNLSLILSIRRSTPLDGLRISVPASYLAALAIDITILHEGASHEPYF